MIFTESTSVQGFEVSKGFATSDPDERVMEFLRAINTGVIGYKRREVDVPEESREIRRE